MADAGESGLQREVNGNLDPSDIAASDTAPEATTNKTPQEGSSDGESERATRERLKKTSIAGIAQQAKTSNDDSHLSTPSKPTEPELNSVGNDARGRPPKKRSFEDLARGDTAAGVNSQGTADAEQPNSKSGHHKRMRSRDVVSGEHTIARFEGEPGVASPVQEESDAEAHNTPGGPGILVDPVTVDEHATKNMHANISEILEDKEKSRHEPSTTKLSPSSGFANASSTSPFGTAQISPNPSAQSDNETKSTSASAFASSGLSAFGSSEKSPFGAAAQSTGGFGSKTTTGFGSTNTGFGSSPSSSSFATKPAKGGFGSSTGFGSASGFGTSTGFGSAKPFGSGISSFGGVTGSGNSFGTGKPFIASKDKDADDDESDEDAEDDEAGHPDPADDQDERFIAQDVETGEEAEKTVFACRAKLYHFESEWKERGVGTIKINLREEQIETSETTTQSEEDPATGSGNSKASTARRGRLIMRTDGVHRVILNTPIFKSMTIGQTDGSEPIGKTMHLTGLEGGKPRAFQIKIGKEEVLKELYWKVIDLRTEAKA